MKHAAKRPSAISVSIKKSAYQDRRCQDQRPFLPAPRGPAQSPIRAWRLHCDVNIKRFVVGRTAIKALNVQIQQRIVQRTSKKVFLRKYKDAYRCYRWYKRQVVDTLGIAIRDGILRQVPLVDHAITHPTLAYERQK